MNRPGNRPGEHVTISEITDLIAWARRLSTAVSSDGPGATSPAERAAFHAAKADLFARIEDQHTPHTAAINTAAINTAAINTGLPDPRPNPRRDIR
jgi:hypothetical protein